jgi:dihydrofolate reductase
MTRATEGRRNPTFTQGGSSDVTPLSATAEVHWRPSHQRWWWRPLGSGFHAAGGACSAASEFRSRVGSLCPLGDVVGFSGDEHRWTAEGLVTYLCHRANASWDRFHVLEELTLRATLAGCLGALDDDVRAVCEHGSTSSRHRVYADVMNQIPKVVFSGTLTRADWPETRIASGALAEDIDRLKREPGGVILAHGGANFVDALIREQLIDEYRLVIHPVVIGHGTGLFSALREPLRLDLVDARTFRSGTTVRVYRPLEDKR